MFNLNYGASGLTKKKMDQIWIKFSLKLCVEITFRIQEKNRIRSHIKTTKFKAELMRLGKDVVRCVNKCKCGFTALASYSLVQYFDLIPFRIWITFLHYGFKVSFGSNGTILNKILHEHKKTTTGSDEILKFPPNVYSGSHPE